MWRWRLCILLLFSFTPFVGVVLFVRPADVFAQSGTTVHVPKDIGTTSTLLLPARPLRVFLTITNLSDTDVFCSLDGNPAVVNASELIYANGGKTFWDVPPTVPRSVIFCIHAGTGVKRLVATEKY